MSDTLSVTITRKHNLGNYEHVEGSITLATVIPDDRGMDEAIDFIQGVIRPYLTQESLLRGTANAPKAQVEVRTTEGAAEAAEQPAKRTRAKAEKPAVRGAGRAAEEARTAAEEARSAAEAADPLADIAVPEEPQEAAVDPFADEEPAAVAPPTLTPAEMRKAITLACASDPKVQAKVVEHLHASGFAKFKDVPDEKLGEYLRIVKAGA